MLLFLQVRSVQLSLSLYIHIYLCISVYVYIILWLQIDLKFAGCIFTSGNGLNSFDHPLHKVRGIAREDDEGEICAVIFQVDLYTRLHSIPRTGSAANWADSTPVGGE